MPPQSALSPLFGEVGLPDSTSTRWCGPSPAHRYKTGTEFRVPLSDRAVELLSEARGLTEGSGLVFPSPATGRPLSDNTSVKLLRDLDLPSSAHGLRATFPVVVRRRRRAPTSCRDGAGSRRARSGGRIRPL